MSDVTEAPTQDAIAESLLGTEDQQQTAVEQPETEQPQEAVETQEQPLEQEQQPEQEAAEDWLPSEQDKVFPDEVLQRYCQRYGLDENILANPQLRQLVTDKINTDIYLQQQQQFEQQPEPEPVQEPTRTEPQLTREQYFQNLDRVIAERTDPEVAKSFHKDFLSVWQRPEAEQPMAFAQVASKYMLNLVQTFIPEMLKAHLGSQLDSAFPGFGKMYERSSHAMAWDSVRNSNPQFSNLPAYGTKEFSQKLLAAAERVPEVAEMIDEAAGKPMNPQQTTRWYTMLARIASGQNVNPELLRQAASTGAKNARRAEVRRSAGNLGSGQSNAASGGAKSSRFQTNEDLFDEDTMALYQQEHGRL
jgi:hypothetical protein